MPLGLKELSFGITLLRNTRVVKGRVNFYLSLAVSLLTSIATRRVTNPTDHYIGESVCEVEHMRLLLNRDTSFGFYLNLSSLEPKTFNYIKKSKGRVFVDIGANAGGSSIVFFP